MLSPVALACPVPPFWLASLVAESPSPVGWSGVRDQFGPVLTIGPYWAYIHANAGAIPRLSRIGLRNVILVSLVLAILLFSASLGNWQYGLMSQFRWTVEGLILLLVLTALHRRSAGWSLTMVAIFVLYNPFVPVRLAVDTLEIVDLLAAVFVFAAGIEFSQ